MQRLWRGPKERELCNVISWPRRPGAPLNGLPHATGVGLWGGCHGWLLAAVVHGLLVVVGVATQGERSWDGVLLYVLG